MKAKPLPLAYYNFLGSKTVPVVCLLRMNAFLPDLLQDSVQCTVYTILSALLAAQSWGAGGIINLYCNCEPFRGAQQGGIAKKRRTWGIFLGMGEMGDYDNIHLYRGTMCL